MFSNFVFYFNRDFPFDLMFVVQMKFECLAGGNCYRRISDFGLPEAGFFLQRHLFEQGLDPRINGLCIPGSRNRQT